MTRLRLEVLRRNLKADRRALAILEGEYGGLADPWMDKHLAALRDRVTAADREIAKRSRS